MSEGLTLFDLFEEFLDSLDDGERRQAERWINLFKSYLATYGGIAVEEEEWAEEEGEDWPAPEPDLEDEDEGDAAAPWLFVPVDRLGEDHVADFLGWYLVQYVVLTTAEAGEAVAWAACPHGYGPVARKSRGSAQWPRPSRHPPSRPTPVCRLPSAARLRHGAYPPLSPAPRQTPMLQMPRPLLQTGDEGAGACGDAVCGTEDAGAASVAGVDALDRGKEEGGAV